MRVQYPSHLYIRCDRDLRNALLDGAQAAGETVSAFARRQLRAAVSNSDRTASADRARETESGRGGLDVAR